MKETFSNKQNQKKREGKDDDRGNFDCVSARQ